MRVTFGRYIPKNSVIHRMDPRFKLAMIILLIVAIFFPIGFTGYIFMTATVGTLFVMSKLNWRMLTSLIWPVLFIFIVILGINVFVMHPSSAAFDALKNNPEFYKEFAWFDGTNGEIKLGIDSLVGAEDGFQSIGKFAKLGPFWFSEKAVYSALLMSWRIYLMIMLTSILTGTTQPLQLTLAIEDLLWPLKVIKIPVYILSMIISIALRMIPTLIDEAGRIMKAQSSRGIDMKNGKTKDKAKGITSLIIPLLVSSFQKAEDLAYAMDARGYDPHAPRTRFVRFKFSWVDFSIFIVVVAIAIMGIVYGNLSSDLSWVKPLYIDQLVLY